MHRLSLPTVTLCAAASVNVAATVRALRTCLSKADFADCLLLTDALVPSNDGIRVVTIPEIRSSKEYSDFMLRRLVDHVWTSHCLVVQWDGYILDAEAWDPVFLEHDYIGAPWPQFGDDWNVGNGGFSLRSRRLIEACRDSRFRHEHPEDLAICRTNRQLLEQEHGIRFAAQRIAERFSFERRMPQGPTFGFHGIFNMVPAIGVEAFWQTYRSLDDRSSAATDFGLILRQLGTGKHALKRRLQFVLENVGTALVR